MSANGGPTYDRERIPIGFSRGRRYTDIHIRRFLSSFADGLECLVDPILVTLKNKSHRFVFFVVFR